MASSTQAAIRTVPAIADIQAAAWDACAVPDPATFNPFGCHAFLAALEEAGTVGRRTGWLPQHVVFEGPGGAIEGVSPVYVKSHSQGEYVFDHAWAEALERSGGSYYPKLQCAVPFTPVPGPRLLARPGPDAATTRDVLASGIVALAREHKLSSAHITFVTEPEWRRLGELGFLLRTGKQYHWHNAGYAAFDDFLATLASRKRKAVRKERAQALAGGLDVELLVGADITEAHWDAFFAFYMDTGSRKWGRPYLNRVFFSILGQKMGDRCLLVMVRRGQRYVAGALNLIGGDCLYGRYWGTVEHHDCLHFEVCYYQAIDFAIARRLARVEAGAQGNHKLARGYLPVVTYSAHWISDPGFARAVARFLEEERAQIDAVIETLAEQGPYRKTPQDD